VAVVFPNAVWGTFASFLVVRAVLVRNPDSRYLDVPRRATSQLGSQLQTNDEDVFVGIVLAIEFTAFSLRVPKKS
jgi:hypothetical protein